ncbi:MAG: hypothetical protein M3367_14075 [Acidobacteriota bacterium]|nr:hypothetical protein [Acidobacteriota bacterium]
MKLRKSIETKACVGSPSVSAGLALKPSLTVGLLTRFHPCLSVFVCGFILFCGFLPQPEFSKAAAKEDGIEKQIEAVLFTKQEFFGAEAIVPFPTAKARDNLTELQNQFPYNVKIAQKLAELDEKLGDFVAAEKRLVQLAEANQPSLENLAAFYNRRARFSDEAKVLEKRFLAVENADEKAEVFSRLIEAARLHDFGEYLSAAFYEKVLEKNLAVYPIFEQLIERFSEEENYAEALKFTRQAKSNFPEKQSLLLEKEISILLEMKKADEAEKIYQASFNPFWSDEETNKFYAFLSGQNRLRAYGAELKRDFRVNPSDFQTAIRLAHYQKYDGEPVAPIVLQLEKYKKNWTAEELVTTARFSIGENEGDLASRFLYTLFLRDDFKEDKATRAKVLYQLFEIFSDAERQRLSLVKGDLRFYEDVAKADTNPGIATGVLSLIFSDAKIKDEFAEKEKEANKLYNRAAAYRLFSVYKQEFPTSPELAQMYLDIVRLYTAGEDTEIAEKTLLEFEQRYEKAADYASVALKLADAFAVTKRAEKTREIYQKILDYSGKSEKMLGAKNSSPISNDGINIPIEKTESESEDVYSSYEPQAVFRDYLGEKEKRLFYRDTLEKYVGSLAKEKQTAEILALYSREISKYPNQEWLYEERLEWLRQTNLTEEELQVYREALERFQTDAWRDKLARWFLRVNRKTDFAEFSVSITEKLNNETVERHLKEFAKSGVSASNFDKEIYLKLYLTAHERFPQNVAFVRGLLEFYKANKWEKEWRDLAARYYFASGEIREQFLNHLAEKGELRLHLSKANGDTLIYKLFRADAAARLSNFETAVGIYRELNQLYPNVAEFSGRFVNFTRSFGQKDKSFLIEAARLSQSQADYTPSSNARLTEAGEIQAELGDYEKASENWEKLIATARGTREVYLETATVYWDYYQFEKARQTIGKLREKEKDETLYAFEMGAIYEGEKNERAAIDEYVKALDTNRRDEEQKSKAQKRLAGLSRRPKLAGVINSSFQTEISHRKDASFLILAYAEVLSRANQMQRGENLLYRQINASRSLEFLESAREFYSAEDNFRGEQTALRRLAEVTASPRQKIQYNLKLVESFRQNRDRSAAKSALNNLTRKFPTNYGVLSEAAIIYRHLGFDEEAVTILQSGVNLGKGNYREIFAQKLAKLLVELNRLDSAEKVLSKLHAENKNNTEIFRALASVYVRKKDKENLRRVFSETVSSLKDTDLGRRELNETLAGLRRQMIDAFTRLGDYPAAVEQFIEIINHNSDAEEAAVEKAIAYVNRYGGADTLLAYYEDLSKKSFKNYRWNVVLAKLYQAKNDIPKAVENYQSAIVNQPEMTELYIAVAELESSRANYHEAIKNLDTVLELTGDAPEFVKRKIVILEKWQKLAEAESLRAKLPAENKSKEITLFEQAEKSRDAEKARELYRQAFNQLSENPLNSELLKAADINGFVQTTREIKPLDQINEELWQLREKLIRISEEVGSENAGEAGKRLSILDGAITESVGKLAKKVATDDELKNLHEFLSEKIDETRFNSDVRQTVSLVQNISRRIGFGDLEEKILRKKLSETRLETDREIYLRNLVNFYNERGAYRKTFELLTEYEMNDLNLMADAARLVGDGEKELEILRRIYWGKGETPEVEQNENVTRYLEILYQKNRAELASLTEKSSRYQLQLINFLLGKGERQLSHQAIENAQLSNAWKLSRNAETSLALKEFGEDAECYFCEALQFETIGGLIRQTPDKKSFLINDDWFQLTRGYGEWLLESGNETVPPAKFLAAMTENRPLDMGEQFKLGTFYLQKGKPQKATERFRLALELSPKDESALAHLGAAYYLAGEKAEAENVWKRLLADKTLSRYTVYFQALQNFGLAEKARADVFPILVERLKKDGDDLEEFVNLIRLIAASFGSEKEKADYFLKICNAASPGDTVLAENLLSESLISENETDLFYEILIKNTDDSSDSDYEFVSVLQRTLSADEAEAIFDQENEYKTAGEPMNERYGWQRQYLELLVKRQETAKAKTLLAQIEKQLAGRYARPEWLRLIELRLRMKEGNYELINAERFIGISPNSSVIADIKPPSIERLNNVLRLLKEENLEPQALQIQKAFYARMLALGKFEAANLTGLARALFQTNDAEKALKILQIYVAANGEGRETALAELDSLEIIKRASADRTKISEAAETEFINGANALHLAAETASEFGQTNAAIAFREKLLTFNSTDTSNQLGLARLYAESDKRQEAVRILENIGSDKNAPRVLRWQASLDLQNLGEAVETKEVSLDAYSQFFNGFVNAEKRQKPQSISFFVNSLIADQDAKTSARIELVKLYALTDKPFAALRLAESIKEAKSDETLSLLSEAAEKTNDFQRAIEFEKSKNLTNQDRIEKLSNLEREKNKKATDYTVDLENTRLVN